MRAARFPQAFAKLLFLFHHIPACVLQMPPLYVERQASGKRDQPLRKATRLAPHRRSDAGLAQGWRNHHGSFALEIL